ncbi:MAG TPA: EAL domain-containing protein [Candidatus Limnocylindria bacterium]|nr:EAL domain-containing protein [Candidatus Limnocylindria bacterium]
MAIVRLRPEDLRRAIADGTLSLQFQPQVHAPTGKLVGAEAFVRWPHPSYGMIGPGDIIPLVEQGGFHVELDRWVLTAACGQLARWASGSLDVPIVAANIWAHTLRAPDVVDIVREIVLASGVPLGALEIECPRGTVRDASLAEPARRLRALGVRVASEELGDRAIAASARDFDTLKIGYPLARDLLVAGSAAADAVTAIVEAARSAGARVVADSVESPEQEDALRALGCEIVQGYLYGPEVSAAELQTLAAAGAKRSAE